MKKLLSLLCVLSLSAALLALLLILTGCQKQQRQADIRLPEPETPAAEEDSSPFKVKLQRFVIKNMNLIYDDQQGKMYADIRDFNALCAGDLGSDRTTLKLEAETKSLTYKMNGIPFLANANISA